MEEIRQQENTINIPPGSPQQTPQNSTDSEEFAFLPIQALVQPGTYEETKKDIFSNEDRSRWLKLILKELSESDIAGKDHVEQYLHHMYRHMCKAKTVYMSYRTIEYFLRYLQSTCKRTIREIKRNDIESYVEHKQDQRLKLTTVRLELTRVRAFIRFLIDQGEVPHDVLSRKIMIKLLDTLPRAIDPEDLRGFLSVIDNIRDNAFVLLLLRTGMRIGELLNTKPVDINLKDKKIPIYEAMKTGVGRVVYYSEDAGAALGKWLKKRDSSRDYLFYGQGNKGLGYSAARSVFMKYIEKAGLTHKGYTVHCLRHTYASELLNAGMRLEHLQKLMGHTSAEVTRRYARLTDKTRKEEYFKAMKKIERGDIDGHY
ncbi:MAG: tyrosine-type recombinase/integrase [Planctomycetota bacterium]|jgi:integrase/recombinase XerD